MTISVGDRVRPVVDSNVGTNHERWTGRVTAVRGDSVVVSDAYWRDVDGDEHPIPGGPITMTASLLEKTTPSEPPRR